MNNLGLRNKSLKEVVVAVEPTSKRSTCFNVFSKTIKQFQIKGLLPSTSILSINHSALYLGPISWYRENQDRYVEETKSRISELCSGQFEHGSIHVLKGQASSNQFLVEQASGYLNDIRSNLLVVLSSDRTGVPYWFLGSFSETAALSLTVPILIIKPHVKGIKFSAKTRVVIAVDASVVYPSKYIKWISDFALPAGAKVDLVYVKPEAKGFFAAFRKPKKQDVPIRELRTLQKALIKFGLDTTLIMINEKQSVAHSIVDYADKKNAWAIITMGAQRKLARRLLMGSTARRILSLTKRPYISLRLN